MLEPGKDRKIIVERKAKSPKVGKEKGQCKGLTETARVGISVVWQGLTREACAASSQSVSEVFHRPPLGY